MATKNFVPRSTGEGQIGTDSKKWNKHIAISGAYSYVSASSKGSFSSLYVGGNTELAGDLTLGGNITIGDADTDSLVITADLSSSIIPNADSTYNIGSTTKNWKHGYIEELSSTHITASGNVEVTGNISGSVSSTGSFGYVKIPDDGELSFGASDDLRIYHNGSHSIIKDGGTGNLILRTSAFQVKNVDNDETMIQANEDGNVILYHNDNQKFTTAADGINVTGRITATTHITASGNISASGTVFASKFESAGDAGETISFNDNLNITGNITASNNISASGDIRADGRIYEGGTSVIDHATAMAIVFGG